MNVWVLVRLAVVAFAAASSFLMPLHAQAPIDWTALLVILISSPIGLLLVLGLQTVNPRSAKVWHRPSWRLNPFNFHEPLQFFHLGAYVCLAQGLALLARLAVSSVPFYVESLVPLAMSVGVLVGLQLAMLLYRSKMAAGT